jgi:hypothetical protein
MLLTSTLPGPLADAISLRIVVDRVDVIVGVVVNATG